MKKITILSAAVAAGLFLAATAQAQIILSTPSGATAGAAGLAELVIHVGYNAGDSEHGYNVYPTNLGISDTAITTIQNYALTYDPANYPNNIGSYTFQNTNDGFQYSGSLLTNAYLGADAAGAALTDTTHTPGLILSASGYIDITPDLVGNSYTFTIANADDAGRIGGQTIVENNYFGDATGAGSGLAFAGTQDVTFNTAGLYAVNVLTYQNGGGLNFNFTATPDPGSTAFSYVVAQAPEPSTWALMLGGLLALAVLSRRRAVRS